LYWTTISKLKQIFSECWAPYFAGNALSGHQICAWAGGYRHQCGLVRPDKATILMNLLAHKSNEEPDTGCTSKPDRFWYDPSRLLSGPKSWNYKKKAQPWTKTIAIADLNEIGTMKPYQVISYKSMRTHTGAKPRGKFAKIPISMNCIRLIIFKFVKIIWFYFFYFFLFCLF